MRAFELRASAEELGGLADVSWPEDLPPSPLLRPLDPVLALPGDGEPTFFVWGLVPSWAKDQEGGVKLTTARAETAAEKPSFRGALRYRRCVLPAMAFFEWREEPNIEKPGQPVLFDDAPKPSRKAPKKRRRYRFSTGDPVFAIAGLWETWTAPDGSELRTCAVLTVEANAAVAPFSERMPGLLAPETIPEWLDTRNSSLERLEAMLRGVPAEAFVVERADESS